MTTLGSETQVNDFVIITSAQDFILFAHLSKYINIVHEGKSACEAAAQQANVRGDWC